MLQQRHLCFIIVTILTHRTVGKQIIEHLQIPLVADIFMGHWIFSSSVFSLA